MRSQKTDSRLSDVQVVARCPLFAGLPAQELSALASIGRRQDFAAGQDLFLAGDPPGGLHVVVRGRIRIYVLSPRNGREITLALEHPFMTVAELPSLDGGPYPANAQALEDSATLLLEQAALDRLLLERSAIALHLLRTVGGRLRRLVGLVEQLSFQGVLQRLALYLLEESSAGLPFALEPNAVIAAHVGTVPELVSRNLARLHQSGAIQLAQRRITGLDQEALLELTRD
jgi:CRP/FNR family transcriptional regulator